MGGSAEREECGFKRSGCDFCYFAVRFTDHSVSTDVNCSLDISPRNAHRLCHCSLIITVHKLPIKGTLSYLDSMKDCVSPDLYREIGRKRKRREAGSKSSSEPTYRSRYGLVCRPGLCCFPLIKLNCVLKLRKRIVQKFKARFFGKKKNFINNKKKRVLHNIPDTSIELNKSNLKICIIDQNDPRYSQ